MDLVLIRHPAVDIDAGVCYGSSDIALREPARDGTTVIARKLAARGLVIERLYCSPLTRCASVAALLAQDAGVGEQIDPRLAELDFGSWERRRWDDVPRHELDEWAANIEHARAHGGESMAMCAQRVSRWLDALCSSIVNDGNAHSLGAQAKRSVGSEASGQPATVVLTHAGVIRLMTAAALDLPTLACIDWTLDMAGICRLTRPVGARRWALHFWND